MSSYSQNQVSNIEPTTNSHNLLYLNHVYVHIIIISGLSHSIKISMKSITEQYKWSTSVNPQVHLATKHIFILPVSLDSLKSVLFRHLEFLVYGSYKILLILKFT